jgi:hypothetical protein
MTQTPEPKPNPRNTSGFDIGASSDAPMAVPSTLIMRYTIVDKITPAMIAPHDSRGRPSRVVRSFMVCPK